MLHELKMPDLATTGGAVKILRWLAQPGDSVSRGENVLEVETDKAAMEVESTAAGTLKEIIVQEGESVDAGTVIAVIQSGEEVGASADPEKPTQAPAQEPKARASSPAASSAKSTKGLFARNRATAAAKAETKQPATSSTSEKPTFAAPGTLHAVSIARKTAARRLQQSKQTIPHFYLQTSANAEPMMARRNAALPDKLAWDAFFVKAIHNAIARFELMACRWEDDQLIPQGTDTIGVAADIHGDLFVVPVESPAEKNIEDISRDIRARVSALRSGDPLARIMKPGVMTVTNLGASNIETFTAIINPPESAILAVGKIRPVVIAVSETAFAIQYRVNLTLSIDHRVANGKYAADFLGAVVDEIENL
jgi:pyruvate dehydrogenase E2 component (dihydrolipoamide acetyltransferase)